MGRHKGVIYKPRAEKCLKCERSFEQVHYHSKDMCRNCYNYNWVTTNRTLKKDPKVDHCLSCLLKWGDISKKGKEVSLASKGMCRPCYQQYYNKTKSSDCKRCGKEMGKRVKGVCSLCRVELETIKSPGRRGLPTPNKAIIDKETKETLRKLMNRYKFGLNTLVDPFIVTDIYLDVFSVESTRGKTASKNDFNLDQFDQENQVIAMLKLLKIAYDKT